MAVGATDELFVGAYVVYRFQRSTESRITIPDVAWRLKHTLKNKRTLGDHDRGRVLHNSRSQRRLGLHRQVVAPERVQRGRSRASTTSSLGLGVLDEGSWNATQLEGGWAIG